MNIASSAPHDQLGESGAKSNSHVWLGIALFALTIVADLVAVDRLASYASTVCGVWQMAIDRALLAEVISSTVFVCLATAFALSLVKPNGSLSPAWAVGGAIFVVIETLFKVVIALYESFFLC